MCNFGCAIITQRIQGKEDNGVLLVRASPWASVGCQAARLPWYLVRLGMGMSQGWALDTPVQLILPTFWLPIIPFATIKGPMDSRQGAGTLAALEPTLVCTYGVQEEIYVFSQRQCACLFAVQGNLELPRQDITDLYGQEGMCSSSCPSFLTGTRSGMKNGHGVASFGRVLV